MNDFDDSSLIDEFVTESREHLEAIEPDLLAMEQEGTQVGQEIINRVFRAIHSIKGGAGFLAYESLKRLSHVMENVLMQVRDGALSITPEITDALLAGVDRLRAMLDDIESSDGIPYEKELNAFNAIIEDRATALSPAQASSEVPVAPQPAVSATPTAVSGTIAQEAASPPPAQELLAAFGVELSVVERTLAHGMTIYLVTAHPARDLLDRDITPQAFLDNVESVGALLGASVDFGDAACFEKAAASDASVTLLFSTVLEPDLAAVALELPEDQAVALSRDALKALVADGASNAVEAAREATPGTTPDSTQVTEAEGIEESGRKGKRDAVDTLRVRVDLLSKLMNLAGELVLGRNQLMLALAEHAREDQSINRVLQNINQVTTELQEGIMQTRMQPVGVLFNRYPRIIRDMARSLGKEIDIDIRGAEVELDKSIVELLADPLTHIIRNCADHALEPPDERKRAGKPATGEIQLRAYHEAGQVNISISDDGRGIDPEKMRLKALEKGVITRDQSERMTERELVHLVFAPGFSTAEKITDVSGRGVGMDVVMTNIEKLGGHVEIESIVGQGTSVHLRLPLTLAIISSLIVEAGGHRFAVPQVNLIELVWVRASEVRERIGSVHGVPVLRLRGRLLPLVRLTDVLGMERFFVHPETGDTLPDSRENLVDRRDTAAPGDGTVPATPRQDADRRTHWKGDYNILVLQVGANSFGLIVDALLDSEEIVVKPLSTAIKECRCFAGATIMGDGRVIMILDALGIAERAQLQFADLESEEKRRRKEEADREAEAAALRRSVIFFNSAGDEYFAVPQDKIMRLECVPATAIETIGSKEIIQYRGAGLPLVRLDRYLPVKPLPEGLEALYLIIPKCGRNGASEQAAAGIIVSRIVDAMDVQVRLEQTGVKGPGLEGSAIVNNKLTLFLDPVRLLDESGLLEDMRS